MNSHRIKIALLLTLGNLFVFFQTLRHDFVDYDDYMFVHNVYVVQGVTWEGIRWAFLAVDESFVHPVTMLFYMVQVDLFGVNPTGFHLMSFLLHTANVLLVFFLFNKLTNAPWKCSAVAVLFAWHPMHVENVAWVSGQKDLLSVFFILLAIGAYVRFVETKNRGWFAVSALWFVFSLLSKMVMVVFPALLLLLDIWPLKRWKEGSFSDPGFLQQCKRLLFEKIVLIVISLFFGWLTVYGYRSVGEDISLEASSLLERSGNALLGYLWYLEKTFLPFGLAVHYPLREGSPPVGGVLFVAGLLMGLSVWAIQLFKSKPYVTAGWFWFVIGLLPVIGLARVGPFETADRYAYFPHMGLLLLIVWGGSNLFSRMNIRSWVPSAMLGTVAGIFLSLAFVQTTHWKNSETLFRHSARINPENHTAHANLGLAFIRKGEYEASIPHLKRALLIKPDFPQPRFNLAKAYMEVGNNRRAISQYRQILKSEPNQVVAHFKLGKLYDRVGEGAQAIWHMRIAQFLLIREYGKSFEKTIEAQRHLEMYYRKYNLSPQNFPTLVDRPVTR